MNGLRAGILRVATGWGQRVVASLFVAALLLGGSAQAGEAHDIPATVVLRIFVRPEGNTLRVLVRTPLVAMRDVNFPLRDSLRYLDVPKASPLLAEAATTWILNSLQVYEDDKPLNGGTITATRISLPSDRAFAEFKTAAASVRAPELPPKIDLPWQQAMLDVEIDYQISTPTSRFSIDPTLARLGVRTTTVLRFLPANGSEHAMEYVGDPGLVRLDPHWYQAFATFVKLGFEHIWSGIDHLLFILCLIIPIRRVKPLLIVISAFTVAHSITLIASAMGYAPNALWFPPLVEVLIAFSIAWTAIENILFYAQNGAGPRLEYRWITAFVFGLVHGFGFSFALRESLQFSGTHLLTALLSFNLGVEGGQISALCLFLPVLWLVSLRWDERWSSIIISALVLHTAWHWLLDRGNVLLKYPMTVRTLDVLDNVLFVGGVILAVIFAIKGSEEKRRRKLRHPEPFDFAQGKLREGSGSGDVPLAPDPSLRSG